MTFSILIIFPALFGTPPCVICNKVPGQVIIPKETTKPHTDDGDSGKPPITKQSFPASLHEERTRAATAPIGCAASGWCRAHW